MGVPFDLERVSFDGVDEQRIKNPGILVQRGRIIAVGEGSDRVDPDRHITLDDDHTILPGFIDLHTHYHVDLFDAGRVDETKAYPLLYSGNGRPDWSPIRKRLS
ncbi:imidazolonepropionase-like amidohydrolase [Natronospira proteinivora]|uniref:Imidazolonepropionase-like amidohydrolase n=1 Tax=Natronospira proteinivora TaxID=1807133 RepID=A0ABT1G8Y0_9GAMM|nr:imidazolonepropionase-like amidohydrolase [Natronospira proteinivora]